MSLYMTTTATLHDTRRPTNDKGECWWDLDNRGVKSALWWPGTNNFVRSDGFVDAAGITAWARGNPGHDLILFDHETTPFLKLEQGMAVVDAIRGGLPGAKVAFYGANFGSPPAMTVQAYTEPNPAQLAAISAEVWRVAPYHRAAGAVLMSAQFQRPDNVGLMAPFLSAMSERITAACPGAERIVFLQDTVNWSQAGYPAASGAWLAEIINATIDLRASRMAFQPGPLLPGDALRPLYREGWFFMDKRA